MASDADRQAHGHEHLRHAVVGDMSFAFETFAAADDPEQVLGVHTPEAGSASERAVVELAALAVPSVVRGARTQSLRIA